LRVSTLSPFFFIVLNVFLQALPGSDSVAPACFIDISYPALSSYTILVQHIPHHHVSTPSTCSSWQCRWLPSSWLGFRFGFCFPGTIQHWHPRRIRTFHAPEPCFVRYSTFSC
jgi:hypothetical protein